MKNLVAGAEQRFAKYEIKPDQYRINIYISYDRTVVIIAQKDSNYTEWLSVGSLRQDDNSVGACINYLLSKSPLSVSTSLYWKIYEEATEMKYDELQVFYQHVGISKEGESYIIMNGERISRDVSDDYIQQRLIEQYKTCCAASAAVGPSIAVAAEQLQLALTEIRSMEAECPFPWALDHASNHAHRQYAELKNRYSFTQDEQIRSLLYELYQLKTSIYNRYMTAVR